MHYSKISKIIPDKDITIVLLGDSIRYLSLYGSLRNNNTKILTIIVDTELNILYSKSIG